MDIPVLSREQYKVANRGLEHMFSFYDKNDTSAFMVGDPNGEPYVVEIVHQRYHYMSLLIFATSEEDALARVRYGLQGLVAAGTKKLEHFLATEKPSERAPHKFEQHKENHSGYVERYIEMLELLDNPDACKAYQFDKRFVAKIPWATNDNV